MEIVNAAFFDHFINPRNVGEIDEPDGVGVCGDESCGDWLRVTIRVEKDRIAGIRFRCRGCSSAIASSSATTELAAGKRIDEAYAVTADEIEAAVGGLDEAKRHCSLLGEGALRAAIDDFRGRAAATDGTRG